MTQIKIRIPRGLWEDLEVSVMKQDRQFISDVARALGLPVQEAIRKCLGPALTPLPTLWIHDSNVEDICPWLTLRGALWTPCVRPRLSPTLPCCYHEKDKDAKLKTDPDIVAAPRRYPVKREGILYWVDPTGEAPPLYEDGTVAPGQFRFSQHKGKKIAFWISEPDP
jgi:hypothetical protein